MFINYLLKTLAASPGRKIRNEFLMACYTVKLENKMVHCQIQLNVNFELIFFPVAFCVFFLLIEIFQNEIVYYYTKLLKSNCAILYYTQKISH